jgi:hypothetical protein
MQESRTVYELRTVFVKTRTKLPSHTLVIRSPSMLARAWRQTGEDCSELGTAGGSL